MTSKLIAGMLATAALCVVSSPATADEGMWTFDNFPVAKVKAKYGVEIDQAWLDHVRGAAVRLSTGCSASVVSRSGAGLDQQPLRRRMRPEPVDAGPRLLHPRLTANAAPRSASAPGCRRRS